MRKMLIDGKNMEVKDYLTMSDVRTLVQISLDAFINGEPTNSDKVIIDDIRGYMGNPGCFIDAFFRSLGALCIENFDDDLHNKIFEEGKYEEMLKSIKNAQLAYDMAQKNIEYYFSFGNTLNQFLSLVADKLPKGKDLDKILTKLPKEWNKVFSEYQSIVKPNKDNLK